MTELYDSIGHGYGSLRLPDPRIAAQLCDGLGAAASVVNVGAGAGSYEPREARVVAVEPSLTMIRQREAASAPAVCGSSEHLPFADDRFDAALAILTVHHWPDRAAGLRELRRVARERVVILTWDPASPGFWLTDYFPEVLEVDRLIFPSRQEFEAQLGPAAFVEVPIPADCADGFFGAYWRRPEAYLSERVRSAISTFQKIDVRPGLERLERDLESGEWQRRHGTLNELEALDLGYRLVVACASETEEEEHE